MIILLSPAKSMHFGPQAYKIPDGNIPLFLEKTEALARVLKSYSAKDIAEFMDVSEGIAELNYKRFKEWDADFSTVAHVEDELSMKQAITAFTGTVYQQCELDQYTSKDFAFADEHIRILSGFYGVLRPLDYIKPYRLEMGRKLVTSDHSDLYSFWRDDLAAYFDELSVTDGPLVNLASQEYAKVIDRSSCEAMIIDVEFKVVVDRKLVSRGFLAKQARGALADAAIRGRLKNPEDLQKCKPAGFAYSKAHSTDDQMVFIKR